MLFFGYIGSIKKKKNKIMNYEKTYKEAIESIKRIYEQADSFGKELMEKEFPELKESEDEKIRKMLIKLVKKHLVNHERCMAESWLEKQGEKPVKQDTEIRDLWVYIREWNDKFGRLPKDEDELAACIDYVMKRQKPVDKIEQKPAEWSEEDEEKMNWIIATLNNCSMRSSKSLPMNESCEEWLKSLKPNHWKPSEEQMEALKDIIIGKRGPLYDLYFDLEKL